MKIFLALVAIGISFANADESPCGSRWNIVSCVCNDEDSSEVAQPFYCRRFGASVVSCTCEDGTQWPPAPCNDGTHNIASCAQNEETDVYECTCDDGTIFEAHRGRGNGRGRGRR